MLPYDADIRCLNFPNIDVALRTIPRESRVILLTRTGDLPRVKEAIRTLGVSYMVDGVPPRGYSALTVSYDRDVKSDEALGALVKVLRDAGIRPSRTPRF